ncbi:glycosyltransferase family 4 protein [Chthonobacter albigriseus]|uniref:glycosyltransferase family 4 protein n=1 Tax=Chthonobacter albigriseus TaxID=1683161 RepID=UPI0015EE9F6F|nr:glycosyltransferase family 4 protein [Chthonobacter albigriseus]
MRLAIVRRRFNPFGGAERFIVSAVRPLIEHGVSVSVVTEGWDGGAVEGLQQVIVKPGGWLRHQRARHFQKAVAEAVSGRFDLVQSHERLLTADLFRAGDGVHAAWVDRLKRERSGLSAAFLSVDPLHRLTIDTERRMARDTDMVFVANSGLVARELRDWLRLPDERLRIIENGIDGDRFLPATAEQRRSARLSLGLPPDDPVVAFVGSGFERKGAFHLVRAMALHPLQGFHLLVAGADRRLADLRAETRRLHIEARVHLLGGVADVAPVLAAADLIALPSLYDPMPNAVLEGLFCGLPAVVTDDTGIADPVRDSGAGAIATRDPDSIAAAVAMAYAERRAMSAAALRLRDRFSLDRATAQWARLYAELS